MPSWELFVASLTPEAVERERHPLLTPKEEALVVNLRIAAAPSPEAARSIRVSAQSEAIMRALAREKGKKP